MLVPSSRIDARDERAGPLVALHVEDPDVVEQLAAAVLAAVHDQVVAYLDAGVAVSGARGLASRKYLFLLWI